MPLIYIINFFWSSLTEKFEFAEVVATDIAAVVGLTKLAPIKKDPPPKPADC
jgi:hypothetical protein